MTRAIDGRGRVELGVVLHYSKDDISLVLDGCESHGGDHYDHEVERLDPC